MSDKQIIIYKKECYNEPHCSLNQVLEQLKAKEQECEELRGVIRKDICSHYVLGECSQKHHNNCVGRNQCIKDLEQECEELKKQLKEMNEVIRTETTRCSLVNSLKTELDQLKAENDELKEIRDSNFLHALEEQKRADKFSKTLTEIKEIAESEMDSKEFMAVQCMLNGSVDNKNKVLEQILQKISECEGNNE